MSFPRCPAYKDSGVSWLGEMPAGWSLRRLRTVFVERNERSSDGSETLLSVSAYTGVTPRSELVEEGEYLTRAETLDGYKICHPGDLVINIMLAWNRGLAVTPHYGIVSPAYCVFGIVDDSSPDYLDYLLRTDRYTLYFKAFSSGVIDSRLRLYPDVFRSLFCILPDRRVQEAIVDFLDRETAKLDALIAEQERLIELLQEKRQAVISHAVTKGLNPDVPTKSSGVEWLGDVPAHWLVFPLKRIVATPITDGPHETPQFLDDGVPFVSAEAVSSGRIDFAKIRGFISAEDNERYSLKYAPRKYDIFMVKSGATTGVTAIVEGRTDFNIWSPLAVVRCGPEAHPHFVLAFMRSRNFQEAVQLNWSYGTQQNIGMGVIENLRCVMPPIDEQVKIAEMLAEQNEALEGLIGEAKRSIEFLQERRSALISAAVTGQIDVRGLVEQEAA